MFSRIALITLVFLTTPGAAAETPSRIVSINLCADQLLLALADRDQIVALSPYATDSAMSFFANEANNFRHDAGDAETVIGLHPDLVFAGRFTKRATRDLLTRLGYRVVLLDPARSIDQSIEQIREVAEIVGHPDRGEALVAVIEAARADAALRAGAGFSAALYQRRGYVTGGGTLTDDLMATLQLTNAGGTLAGGTGGFVPLERIVAERPDVLVVQSAAPPADDQGSALLAHPALAALYPLSRRIVLPERLTVCGGPSLPEAFDWLADEVLRVQLAP